MMPDKKTLLNVFADHQGQWTFMNDDGLLRWFNWETTNEEENSSILVGLDRDEVLKLFVELVEEDEYLGGCPCGCRGDFDITDKGLSYIGRERVKAYRGY